MRDTYRMTKTICLLGSILLLSGCFAISETDAIEVAVTYASGPELAVDSTQPYDDEPDAGAETETPTTNSTQPCQ